MESYSVLMPVYYKEKPEHLRQSIESMLNQTYKTNDFIIVEDGPLTTELYEVLDEFERKDSCIRRIVQKENMGCGASLNNGLKHCKNDLVARMDSDDISLQTRCEKQVKEFIKYPKVSVIGTAMYEFSDDSNSPEYIKLMPETSDEVFEYGKRRSPFNHPTVMYRKSIVYAQNGGYCIERGMDDTELFPRLLYSGVLGRNINEPLLKYRANQAQNERRINIKDSMLIIKYAIRNFKQHYASLSDVLFVVIANLGACFIPTKLRIYLMKKLTRKNVKSYSE